MTFTYNGTLTTDLDKLRFYVGDIVSGSGLKPAGTNFTDEELNGLLTAEGSVPRAVAAVYEALAAMWGVEVDISVGPRSESYGQAADRYAKLALLQRAAYGRAGTVMVTRIFTRTDGYSDDVDMTEI